MADVDWTGLIEAATAARASAHAPYSKFAVGAALLASDGRVFVGCNVENASYGLTVCAERHAVAAAVAAGVRDFSAIAVVTGAAAPTPPCGACRQVLAEFARALPVRCVTLDGVERDTDLAELLPGRFGRESLG